MLRTENIGRREFLWRGSAFVAGGALLTVFPPACSRLSNTPLVKRSFISMGTFVEFTIWEENKEMALTAINAAMKAIEKVHTLMSTYDSGSQISDVNRKAGSENVHVDQQFAEVVQHSLSFGKETNGVFDISILPLMEIYGLVDKSLRFPDDKAIQKVMEGVGYSKIHVDMKESTIGLSSPNTKIDVGGIGKGYAVDKAVEVLKEKGIKMGIVNAGGDIYLLGAPEGESGWRVGIQDPFRKDKVVAAIRLRDMAIATSGNYENFIESDGHRYGHIMDPLAGRPSEALLSSTIIASTATEADALATTTFVLGTSKGVEFIERRPGTECALIAAAQDGKGIEFKTSKTLKGLDIL